MRLSSKGDALAFGQLYDRYAGKMINYFARMLWNDREKASDMTQDLFTKIIDKPKLYKEGRKFSTWIYSIANNMCKNEYRHHEVVQRHAHGVSDTYKNSLISSTDDPHLKAFKADLDIELNALDHPHRSCFIMRYKQGLSIKEIADVLECSEGTVKSRLFYTTKKLAKALKHFDPKGI